MPDRILSIRELNRATLTRQFLIERESRPVPTVIERLVGMQAQLASAPFVGLWTRLPDFARDDLAKLIENRTIIKATLMRATLHLFSAEDYLRLHGAVQPALDAAQTSIAKRRDGDVNVDKVLEMAEAYIGEKPRTFADISAYFTEQMPQFDIGAIRYTIRTQLPLVQVPVSGGWSYPGNPQFTLAKSWLSKPVPTENNFKTLVFRYLAAFGPATVTDLQKWSGISKLKAAVDTLKSELVIYRDETKRELFDLPNMTIPDADMPVPVRFLPEFDNLLLAHDKRTRIIADQHKSKVYLPGLRVAATILIDGFVGGVWRVSVKKKVATLEIAPFEKLAKGQQDALIEEAEKLVRFIEPEAHTHHVQIVEK